MKILSVASLYPNAEMPSFGVFVENRLRQVAAVPGVDLRVVAPVPWFPSRAARFGRYASFARVPAAAQRHGLRISHPRFVQIPKLGTHVSPFLLYRCLLRHVRSEILPAYDFDLIDAHFYYPDGVAAVMLAETLQKPVVVTARGTDLNDYPERYPLVRRMIARAALRADASITVCQALKDALVALGTPAERVHVLRNGVDLETFRPLDREAIRRELGLDGPVLLSVGHLIERKGHHLVIEALASLDRATLLIAGDGGERAALEALAERLGLRDRVRFLGLVGHQDLVRLYNAADILVLASSREGWPNVLLEAMASGTPVVATRNWGTPEIVTAPEAGLLVEERIAAALARGIRQFLLDMPSRAATRTFAEGFSWDATTDGQLRLFRRILDARLRRAA